MAIYIRPADTWPDLTLMGRILPDSINYRVGYGFKKKKKPEASSGRVQVLCIPGLNPTRIHIILKQVQNPSSINTLFFRSDFIFLNNLTLTSQPPLLSLSQALTADHPPSPSDTPLTVMASLSFMAP